MLARARAYSATARARRSTGARAAPDCAGGSTRRPARRTCAAPSAASTPRAYAMLPAWAMAGGRPAQPIDARLLDNALWLLRTYRLRVTAAREGGHNTHGDGTALDLVPAEPVDQAAWDASAGALARDLGWTPACGASGVRPACPLVPAIQFVGYEGYPGHGSPRTCTRQRAPRTCTSPGPRRATARARRQRHATGSWRSPPQRGKRLTARPETAVGGTNKLPGGDVAGCVDGERHITLDDHLNIAARPARPGPLRLPGCPPGCPPRSATDRTWLWKSGRGESNPHLWLGKPTS